jgi:hypothetical protein
MTQRSRPIFDDEAPKPKSIYRSHLWTNPIVIVLSALVVVFFAFMLATLLMSARRGSPESPSEPSQDRPTSLYRDAFERGIFYKAKSHTADAASVWVTGDFYALPFDQKPLYLEAAYRYWFGDKAACVLGVCDATHGGQIGRYTLKNGYEPD